MSIRALAERLGMGYRTVRARLEASERKNLHVEEPEAELISKELQVKHSRAGSISISLGSGAMEASGGEPRTTAEAEIRKRAAQRVEAVWSCVNVLRPDMPLDDRKDQARKFLDLEREDYIVAKPICISAEQVMEMVWRHFQCANRYCSAVLFGDAIAEELNEFSIKQTIAGLRSAPVLATRVSI